MRKSQGALKSVAGFFVMALFCACAAVGQQLAVEGAWVLEDIGGKGIIDRGQSTIEFDGEGGVYGSGGCNRFNGPVDMQDGAVTFGPLAATRRACVPVLMDREFEFLAALDAARRYRLDGQFLILTDESGKELLRLTRLDCQDTPNTATNQRSSRVGAQSRNSKGAISRR